MTVLATLPVPGKPELAVSDATGRVFVNIESTPGQLAVIDLRRLSVSAVWPLPGCDEPTGLAFDAATHRLFSACNNRSMVVTDSRDGHRVAALPIDGSPDGAAFDTRRKLILVSNGEGTLTIAHEDSPDRYSVRQRLVTQPGARTLALDSLSGRIYLVTADFGPTPPATAEQPRPRPAQIPGTFRVLVISLPAVSAR
jgi:DNA-binding beta-propeller fold protein YncE